MQITDTQPHTQTHSHTYTQTKRKKWDFRTQGTSKRVNPSKSPLRKFDPKTLLSLLIVKRK